MIEGYQLNSNIKIIYLLVLKDCVMRAEIR